MSVPQRAAHSGDFHPPDMVVFWGGWNGADALEELNILWLKDMSWYSVDTDCTPWRRNNGNLYIHGGHNGVQWLQDFHAINLNPAFSAIRNKETLPKISWYQPQVSGRIPRARACHTLTPVRNALVMYGGYDGYQCYRDIEVLDLCTNTWTLLEPSPGSLLPEGRNAHTMTLIGNKLYMFGGHAGYQHMGDLHTFDLNERVWNEVASYGKCPSAPRGHGTAFANGHLIVFGGFNGKCRTQAVYSFDIEEQEWHIHRPIGSQVPEARQRHSFTGLGNNCILLFGGFNGTNWLNDMHILHADRLLSERVWTRSTSICLMQSLLAGATHADVKICILASRSKYFEIVIRGRSNQALPVQIDLSRWSTAVVESLIYYLYTDTIDYRCQDPVLLCDLIKLADYVALDDLIKACERKLKQIALELPESELENFMDKLSDNNKFKQELVDSCVPSEHWLQPSVDGTTISDERSNESVEELDLLTIPLSRAASRGSSSHYLFLRSAGFINSVIFHLIF